MKKDKIIIISIIGAVMLGLILLAVRPIKEAFGYGVSLTQQKSKGKGKPSEELREALPEIKEIHFSEVDNKSTCFVTSKKKLELGSMIIPGESLFIETIGYPGKKQLGTPNSYVVSQYDLVTEKLAYEFDLGKELAEEVATGYELPMVLKFEKIADSMQPVISTVLFSENEEDDMITLVINPTSGELSKLTEYPFDLFEVPDFSKQADYFIFSDFDFMAAQGFDEELFIHTDINGILFASLTGASITEETTELVKHFPTLKEHVGKPDDNFIIYFAEDYEKETIMEMFKPTQDKSFVPYQMNKELAVDKQSHEIKSFADYEEWSQFSFKNMPGYEEDLEALDSLMEEFE